ncbi:hypothetical protein C1H46_043467 [Malus baccata]|uniref:Uncharacterized protein n=1 Tax=Malus baccata TaxID=106549 RepID=A0A540K9U1_MALBA|nr:hypothetical protein C1H46_043467 [Malus baccata]
MDGGPCGCMAAIVKPIQLITTTNRLPSISGTKPNQWRGRWNEYGDQIEAHPILGFRRFVGNFRCFQAELDFGPGIGFKKFHPSLAPTTVGDMLLQGVNYASAASGIFNITGF